MVTQYELTDRFGFKFGARAEQVETFADLKGPELTENDSINIITYLFEKGIEEGATLVAGGPGKPEGFNAGYYVKPTIFSDVSNDMTIAREEIFGPVLCILPYEDEDDAVRIANDTLYGLSGYVSSADPDHALDLSLIHI